MIIRMQFYANRTLFLYTVSQLLGYIASEYVAIFEGLI